MLSRDVIAQHKEFILFFKYLAIATSLSLITISSFAEIKPVDTSSKVKQQQSKESSEVQFNQQKNTQEVIENSRPRLTNKTLEFKDLTDEEKDILLDGEVSPPMWILGGLVGTFYGFGLGHILQSRYSSSGWKFTVGEIGSLIVWFTSISCSSYNYSNEYRCKTDGVGSLAMGAFVGFKIWEIIDVWAGPHTKNRKYRRLRKLTGDKYSNARLFIIPQLTGGAMAGLQWSF